MTYCKCETPVMDVEADAGCRRCGLPVDFSPKVRYPEIEVELTGTDGNAFAVLGKVQRALKKGGVQQEEVAEFYAEATSGDYDHLLQTCMSWVEVT